MREPIAPMPVRSAAAQNAGARRTWLPFAATLLLLAPSGGAASAQAVLQYEGPYAARLQRLLSLNVGVGGKLGPGGLVGHYGLALHQRLADSGLHIELELGGSWAVLNFDRPQPEGGTSAEGRAHASATLAIPLFTSTGSDDGKFTVGMWQAGNLITTEQVRVRVPERDRLFVTLGHSSGLAPRYRATLEVGLRYISWQTALIRARGRRFCDVSFWTIELVGRLAPEDLGASATLRLSAVGVGLEVGVGEDVRGASNFYAQLVGSIPIVRWLD